MARAISSRRWSPYGRLRAQVSSRSRSPTSSSSSARRSRASCSSIALARRAQDRVPPAALEVDVQPDEDVVEDGHGAEQADVLEGSPDPERGHPMRRQRLDLVAAGDHATGLPSKTISPPVGV